VLERTGTDTNGNPVTTPQPYPNLVVIDPSAGQTCAQAATVNEAASAQPITWNQAGPPGGVGATGPEGPSGPPGATGLQGPAGKTASAKAGTPVAEVLLGASASSLSTTKISSSQVAFDATRVDYTEHTLTTIGSGTSGAGAGKLKLEPITITKPVDKNTTTLLGYLETGKHFAVGRILIPVPSHTNEYLELELNLVIVSNDEITGSAATGPVETIQLEVGAVKISYVNRDSLGKQAPPSTIKAPAGTRSRTRTRASARPEVSRTDRRAPQS
jgi:type VI protein secretion system component Hcp